MDDLILIHPNDNVGNAITDIAKGMDVGYSAPEGRVIIKAVSDIPFGFKMAVTKISKGDPVIKYGEVIGEASKTIEAGELAHIHNVDGKRSRGDLNG